MFCAVISRVVDTDKSAPLPRAPPASCRVVESRVIHDEHQRTCRSGQTRSSRFHGSECHRLQFALGSVDLREFIKCAPAKYVTVDRRAPKLRVGHWRIDALRHAVSNSVPDTQPQSALFCPVESCGVAQCQSRSPTRRPRSIVGQTDPVEFRQNANLGGCGSE